MEVTSIEVTASAFEVLVGAFADARRDNRELGGSILAYEKDGSVLVAYALPTGPHADRGPGHVRTDAQFQNDAIAKVLRWWPALQYVGDWHVHPMWLPDLSGTDRRTAREILLDDGGRRDHLVLLLVTAPPAGAAVVLGFVARLSRAGAATVGKVQVVRVEDDSPRVVSLLGRPLPPLRAVLDGTCGARGSPRPTVKIAGRLESAGFDPRVGYFHGVRYGRSSLALDLIEAHRVDAIDRLTLALLNRRMFALEDFEDRGGTLGVRLLPAALRRYLAHYEAALGEPTTTGDTPRARIRAQVAELRRSVMGGAAPQPRVSTPAEEEAFD